MRPEPGFEKFLRRRFGCPLWSGAVVFLLACSFADMAMAASWEATVKGGSPGSFPAPRPVHARYRFGWSGFTAATADVRSTKPAGDRLQFDGNLHTVGLARVLWKLDATLTSLVDGTTLHALNTKQIENMRSKRIVTNLVFDSGGVTSRRNEGQGKAEKTRRFDFPNLFDLYSALLYLRSQPLPERSVQRIIVYPATSAYLATVTVLGHERVTVPVGNYNAIKLDLQLNKIGKTGELEPHRKFRRGTVWLSDDSDRLLLRIEAQVFVGTVFVELQSVEFDEPKPRRRPN